MEKIASKKQLFDKKKKGINILYAYLKGILIFFTLLIR